MLHESNITAPYSLLLAIPYSACIILPLKKNLKNKTAKLFNSVLHFVQSAFHSATEAFYQHRGSSVLSLPGPDSKKEFSLKRINMKKSSQSQERELHAWGAECHQDTTGIIPCWTASLSSHKMKAGTAEEEGKGKFQGQSFRHCWKAQS